MTTFQKSKIPGAHGFNPPPEDRSAAMALVLRVGEAKAAEALHVDRLSLARFIAGFSATRGTIIGIHAALSEAPPADDGKQLAIQFESAAA